LWSDEYCESVHLVVSLHRAEPSENEGDVTLVDSENLTTGLRDFRATPDGFTINGRKVTLRGKHEACVFPLTAHPPMDRDSWMRYFRIYKEWGLNHMRCHTWTPPEAAFEAADELGIYIECELPIWWGLDFKDPKQFDYMVKLGRAILDDYGNHPSLSCSHSVTRSPRTART
jgi:beta-galactosidase/beta-glucuronidase